MDSQDFTEISTRYRETSVIQSSAADILLALLNIKSGENVLDVGCGTGNLTKKIFDISGGYVAGIDPSQGMINESKKNYGSDIHFQLSAAEDISCKDFFNVIFCNSSFQWISHTEKAIKKLYEALKPCGRIGIQAPGGREYCPNFLSAVNSVRNDRRTEKIFAHFKNPWFFLDTANGYAELFMKHKFSVAFSEIQKIESLHTPDEVYKIFASGAIAGYLNREYYNCNIDEEYTNNFQDIVKENFNRQADNKGKVNLVFNRIFLVAIKN